MKKGFSKAVKNLTVVAVLFIVSSCSKNDIKPNNGNINEGTNVTLKLQINGLPKEPLTMAELNSLSFMREEEKMARDVYITLYKKWNVNIFSNISASEQTHMDAVLIC